MRKIKALFIGLAILASSLIGYVATAPHAGAANLVSSIDRWDNGNRYSMHWHLDTFDDGTQHLNIDCYQGTWYALSCLQTWTQQQYETVVVNLGTPGSVPFQVNFDSTQSPGYVIKNYPTPGYCCNDETNSYANPITYPGIGNFLNEVDWRGGNQNGALLSSLRPWAWRTESTGATKHVIFLEV